VLKPLLLIVVMVAIAACRQPTVIEISRIQHVENGLLPAIRVRGATAPPPMKLADRMAYYHVPGVGIAVINNGALEWARGYGVAAARETRPVTTDTLFQAASISKPLTAMAALALVQDGRLNLDEDVNLRLKSWRVPDNTFTVRQRVTLRALLAHNAGFNVEDVGSYAAGEPLPTLVQALDGIPPAHSSPIRVEAEPGKEFRYSGGGYSVVQQLLIDVTGKPFPDLMQDLVLVRLGMTSSTFRQPLPVERDAAAATGHDVNGEPLPGRWHIFPQAAAAGLWTTPSDLARFAIEIQRSFKGESNAVLSMEMTKEMMTPRLAGYGFGWWVGGTGRRARFSHPGKNEGFLCMLFAYLDTGQGAVVMTNGDGGNALFNEILRAISHEYGWPDFQQREKTAVAGNRAAHPSYAGEYEVSGIRLTISQRGPDLFVQAPPTWPQPLKLYPAGDDHFFLVDEDVDLSFAKDTQGRVVEMRALAGGQNGVAKKVR
jgi:CubicO group peptidase (beta-lactamase class C family)